MTQALSRDLRERIVEAYLAGGVRQAEVADRFHVSRSVVGKLVRQFRDEGSLEHHLNQCGRKRKMTEEVEQALRDDLQERPDATLEERADKLGGIVSVTTVWEALQRLGQRFKKSRPTLPSNRVPMSSELGATGTSANQASMRNALFSSMKQD